MDVAHIRVALENILKELEDVQVRIGDAQKALVQVLMDDATDEWDDNIQVAFLRLECAQAAVGEAQMALIRRDPIAAAVERPSRNDEELPQGTGAIVPVACEGQARSPAVRGARGISAWHDPRKWLRVRGLEFISERAQSNLDPAFEALSLHIGKHHDRLVPFLSVLKRCVNTPGNAGTYPTGELSAGDRSLVVGLAYKMKYYGLLTTAEYRKERDRNLYLTVVRDNPQVVHFLTGVWLEYYVRQVVAGGARAIAGDWRPGQALFGAKISLPDGKQREVDLLVGLPGDQALWIECKTGDWRERMERLRDLNREHLRLPPDQCALVVTEQLEEIAQRSTSEILGIAVVPLAMAGDWLTQALARSAMADDRS